MPRPALTEEQRRETRRSIQQAAAKLYARNGMKDISARAVAEEAGVSVGTLYTHFGNLTELMQSLWKQPVTKLIDELEAVAASIDEPLPRLRALLEAYARFAHEQRAVYRGAFLFVRPQGQEQPERAPLDRDRFFQLFRQAIQEAQSQGLTRSGDINKLTQTVWAAVHGAIGLPVNMSRLELEPSEQTAPLMIDAMLEWLGSTSH